VHPKNDDVNQFAELLLALRIRMKALYAIYFQRFIPAERRMLDMRALQAVHYNGTNGTTGVEEYLGISGAAASTTVRGLIQREQVKVLGHSFDRRRKVLELTEKGKENFEAWNRVEQAVAARLLKNVPKKDRASLVAALAMALKHDGEPE
jgi:DNA-binding MarR family transcriptional regulator